MQHLLVRVPVRVAAVGAAVLGLTTGCALHSPPRRARASGTGATPRMMTVPPRPNPITQENQKTGDPGWALSPPAPKHALEGYGSRMTVHPGDAVDVAVNVTSTQLISWRLYRIGWYGGAGARLIQRGGPFTVAPQPRCPRDATTSRVECAWASAFRVTTRADALSGVYLVKLHGRVGESYVPFVIDDGRAATVVVDVNVTSWQAYNDWGGESLYRDASGTMPHGKAWEVSFDRPFANDHGAGRLFDYEVDLIRFLEGVGYDVTYTTAFDLSHDAKQLDAAHVFVSAANDEYWSVRERDAVQAARDRGVDLAFLGADQGLWRIRLEPSSSGAPERVIAAYKLDQDRDPLLATEGPTASTARFRDPPLAKPENALVGVMYDSWLLVRQPFVVSDGASWVFAGTGLTTGDSLPAGVSAEFDSRFDNGVEPTGLRTLGSSPVVGARGPPGTASATYYRAASGAEVIGIGSIGWVNGLGNTRDADWRVARITRNILDRFSGEGHSAFPDPAHAPWSRLAVPPKIVGAWSRSVTTLVKGLSSPGGIAVATDGSVFVAEAAGQTISRVAPGAAHSVSTYAGTGTDGHVDGAGARARFRRPLGLALGADGTLYVADSANNVIRAVSPDAAHTVSTYAGVASPSGGMVDGPARSARFDDPVAVAVGPDGAVLVADLYNNRIRRIDPGPGHEVTTLAGSTVGFADGPGASARMNSPSAIAVAPDGTAYFLDTYNQAVRRIGTDDAHSVTTLVGGDGYVAALIDGNGINARLGAQQGLTWYAGRLFVSDVASKRIRVVTPGADAAATRVATLAGNGRSAFTDGVGAHAAFALPTAVSVDAAGRLYVADAGNGAVRIVATS